MELAAAAAAILGPTDADDPQPGRHPVQHLAHRLAGNMQGATAARAGLHLEVEVQLFAFQMIRQARAVRPIRCCRFLSNGKDRQQLLGPGYVGTEVLEPQLELAVCQAFGPLAELMALQLLDDHPKPLDLGLRRSERLMLAGLLGRQLPDQPMQCIDVLGQRSKIEFHAVTLRPPTYRRTAIGVRESIGRMISIRQQQVATASPVSASRHPRSASTAAPASASPNPSPHLPSARRTDSAPASW